MTDGFASQMAELEPPVLMCMHSFGYANVKSESPAAAFKLLDRSYGNT